MAGEKILVVDDDIDFAQLLQLDLRKKAYEVDLAPNGEEGLKKAQSWLPDLIVLDIKMPKMDGYTCIRRLKKEPITKDIPVIVLTSYEPMKDMFKMEGVNDYFVKSTDVAGFLAVVEKNLQKKKPAA